MQEFDSDYLTLPRVPFIIELPTLCFKVHISMSLAAQQEELPYFESIQTPTRKNNNQSCVEMKNIGHKCLDFFATCSVFILIGDGYIIYWEPYGWKCERKIDIKKNIVSLDDDPAKGYEAWNIYSAYEKHRDSKKVEQIIEYLESDQITTEHLKKHFPDFIKHYKYSNRIDKTLIDAFDKAVCAKALRDTPTIRKKTRTARPEINLFMSYQYILSCQSKPNKSAARRKAISLFHPNVNDDDFIIKDDALKSKIKYQNNKDSEELEFLFPSTSKGDHLNNIRHHFESHEVSEKNEFSLILEMMKNGALK